MRTDHDENRESRETNVTSGRSASRRNLTVTIAHAKNIYLKEMVCYRLPSLIFEYVVSFSRADAVAPDGRRD